MEIIGYGWQMEQRYLLSDNDHAVDQNLTTACILLDFNFAQRKEFWSVRSLLCYIFSSRTLAIIKPDAFPKMGQILEQVCRGGFFITQLKMCHLTRNEAFEFYQEHQSKSFFRLVAMSGMLLH